MSRIKDWTGLKYGKLTAIEYTGKHHVTSGGNAIRIWKFSCECGNTLEYPMAWVKNRLRTCCGCSYRTGVESLAWGIYKPSYADGDMTFEQFKEMALKPCHYCNAPPSNQAKRKNLRNEIWLYNGLDRLNSDICHNYDNCVPCCWICNNMKKAMTKDNFLSHIARIYSHCALKELVPQSD